MMMMMVMGVMMMMMGVGMMVVINLLVQSKAVKAVMAALREKQRETKRAVRHTVTLSSYWTGVFH